MQALVPHVTIALNRPFHRLHVLNMSISKGNMSNGMSKVKIKSLILTYSFPN